MARIDELPPPPPEEINSIVDTLPPPPKEEALASSSIVDSLPPPPTEEIPQATIEEPPVAQSPKPSAEAYAIKYGLSQKQAEDDIEYGLHLAKKKEQGIPYITLDEATNQEYRKMKGEESLTLPLIRGTVGTMTMGLSELDPNNPMAQIEQKRLYEAKQKAIKNHPEGFVGGIPREGQAVLVSDFKKRYEEQKKQQEALDKRSFSEKAMDIYSKYMPMKDAILRMRELELAKTDEDKAIALNKVVEAFPGMVADVAMLGSISPKGFFGKKAINLSDLLLEKRRVAGHEIAAGAEAGALIENPTAMAHAERIVKDGQAAYREAVEQSRYAHRMAEEARMHEGVKWERGRDWQASLKEWEMRANAADENLKAIEQSTKDSITELTKAYPSSPEAEALKAAERAKRPEYMYVLEKYGKQARDVATSENIPVISVEKRIADAVKVGAPVEESLTNPVPPAVVLEKPLYEVAMEAPTGTSVIPVPIVKRWIVHALDKLRAEGAAATDLAALTEMKQSENFKLSNKFGAILQGIKKNLRSKTRFGFGAKKQDDVVRQLMQGAEVPTATETEKATASYISEFMDEYIYNPMRELGVAVGKVKNYFPAVMDRAKVYKMRYESGKNALAKTFERKGYSPDSAKDAVSEVTKILDETDDPIVLLGPKGEAQIVRKAGHLEYSRNLTPAQIKILEDGELLKTDLWDVVSHYAGSAADRMSRIKAYGIEENKTFQAILKRVKAEGGDAKLVEEMWNDTLNPIGRSVPISAFQQMSQATRASVGWLALGGSATSQFAAIPLQLSTNKIANVVRAFNSIRKGGSVQRAIDSGALQKRMASSLFEVVDNTWASRSGGALGKITSATSDAFYKANLMQFADELTRAAGNELGMVAADDLFEVARAAKRTGNYTSREFLKAKPLLEEYLPEWDLIFRSRGIDAKMTASEIQNVGARMAGATAGLPIATKMPYTIIGLKHSSEFRRMLLSLKQTAVQGSFYQWKTIFKPAMEYVETIGKPAAQRRGDIVPFLKFSVLAQPIGIPITMIKDMLYSGDIRARNNLQWIMAGMMQANFGGIVLDTLLRGVTKVTDKGVETRSLPEAAYSAATGIERSFLPAAISLPIQAMQGYAPSTIKILGRAATATGLITEKSQRQRDLEKQRKSEKTRIEKERRGGR